MSRGNKRLKRFLDGLFNLTLPLSAHSKSSSSSLSSAFEIPIVGGKGLEKLSWGINSFFVLSIEAIKRENHHVRN